MDNSQIIIRNRYLEKTLESIGEGLIITDAEEKIIFMNKAAEIITGFSLIDRKDIYLNDIFKLSNQGVSTTSKILKRVLTTGKRTGLERDTMITTSSGSKKYISAMISPIKLNDKDITGIVIVFRDVSRFRSLENQLEEEKNKFSAIFDATPVGLLILDNDLKVVNANPSFLKQFQRKLEDILNKGIGSGIGCTNYKDSIEDYCLILNCPFCNLIKLINDVHTTGIAVFNREVKKIINIKGINKEKWFRLNAVPVNINGKKNVILAIDDITKNKMYEKELIRSRDFYLTLFDNFPALIWRAGEDGKCNYFNNSWLEFTGRTLEEEIGYGWSEVVHPDDREKCLNFYNKAFKERKTFEMEYRLKHNSGEYRWIYDVGRPFYDENNKFLGYIGSCYDITERKKELLLLEKYKVLTKGSNDIFIFIDTKGSILEVNKAAVKTYGYTEEEFKSLTLFDLRKSKNKSILEKYLKKIKKNSIFVSTTHYRRDGSSFPVESSWNLVEFNKEKIILCIVRDISERRKLQERLQNRNIELQETLNRLKETQGHLIRQEKLAAIGHLAAGVAHEINNPLGYIMSNVKTLEKYSQKLKQIIESYEEIDSLQTVNKKLESIEKLKKTYNIDIIMEDLGFLLAETNEGLERIKKIVMSLRDFSRIENSDKMIDYDLNAEIEHTLVVTYNEIKYYAEVERNLGDIPHLKLPNNHLNQVLLNIIINAIQAIKEKYTKKKGIIKISTYNDEDYIYCSIEDNGIGIKRENINKIFNPFYTTKEVGQGTGLGLSISYDIIVNKLGGEIIVDSEEGKGSTFIIKIPLNK